MCTNNINCMHCYSSYTTTTTNETLTVMYMSVKYYLLLVDVYLKSLAFTYLSFIHHISNGTTCWKGYNIASLILFAPLFYALTISVINGTRKRTMKLSKSSGSPQTVPHGMSSSVLECHQLTKKTLIRLCGQGISGNLNQMVIIAILRKLYGWLQNETDSAYILFDLLCSLCSFLLR